METAGRETRTARRAGFEIALLAAIGVFLTVIGPFKTGSIPLVSRLAYWQICIVGGGLIGIAVSAILPISWRPPWLRILAVSLLMTPFVSLLVMTTGSVLAGLASGPYQYISLLWQVFAIALPVMAVRALVWRRQPIIIRTRTVIEPPLPMAEAAFRRRLSAKRRAARLLAVEAHDHYIRVHTDAGTELVTMRFADALTELRAAHGYQVHRSWWVAGEAIEAVQWRRGAGEIRLAGQIVAPVSRNNAGALRVAGW